MSGLGRDGSWICNLRGAFQQCLSKAHLRLQTAVGISLQYGEHIAALRVPFCTLSQFSKLKWDIQVHISSRFPLLRRWGPFPLFPIYLHMYC